MGSERESFQELYNVDGIDLLARAVFDQVREQAAGDNTWDRPGQVSVVEFVDPPQANDEADFALALGLSETKGIDGSPFEFLVGLEAGDNTAGILLVVETWSGPLGGLREGTKARTGPDGRLEGRLVILVLKDGSHYHDMYLRDAGWYSELVSQPHDASYGGRLLGAMQRCLGNPSNLEDHVYAPHERLSSALASTLLFPLTVLSPDAAGRYTTQLRELLAKPVNIVDEILDAVPGADMAVLECYRGAADWEQVRLRILARSDEEPLCQQVTAELGLDLATDAISAVQWCDGPMLGLLVGTPPPDLRVILDELDVQHHDLARNIVYRLRVNCETLAR